MSKYISSILICPECGSKLPIPRMKRMREKNHIKDMYCPTCKKEQKMKEIRYCDYDLEEKRFIQYKIIKVFLSHNMTGYTNEELIHKRDIAKRDVCNYLTSIGKCMEKEIKFIDNLHHHGAPKDAGRLWHLGASIQQLEEADYVYFIPGLSDSKGCEAERAICKIYGKQIIESVGDN